MKQFLGSLIMSAIAGVLVTSAIVVAQVPKFEPTPVTATDGKADDSNAKKIAQKAAVPPPQAAVPPPPPVEVKAAPAFAKAVVIARVANLENVVQQYMNQARPLVRAELILVRKVCDLDVEHFRRIHQDTEAAFKDVMTKFAESQQRGRVRVAGKAGKIQRVPALDGITLLHDSVNSVMKKDLTPEQFGCYRAEVEKREAFQKQAAVRYLVDAIDRDLYLSDDQRLKLAESLSSHFDPSWKTSLEYLLYANRFFPAGIDPYVTPLLDASQKKLWEGAQKVAGLGGAFGLLGSFMNDMDALAPELGEAEKADSRKARNKAFRVPPPPARK